MDPLNVCIVYLELTRFINFFTQHITDYHTFRPNKRCFISRRIIFFSETRVCFDGVELQSSTCTCVCNDLTRLVVEITDYKNCELDSFFFYECFPFS